MGTMKPWSYSSLTAFETCPRQYYHLRVAKDIKEEQGDAAKWGEWVHKQFEIFLNGGPELPDKIKQWRGIAEKAAAKPGEHLVEQQMAVSSSFLPAEWWTCWSRGILDFGAVHENKAIILDWKTGNRKPLTDQLKLSAGYIFATYPEVNTVKTGFAWLKENKLDTDTFTREQVPQIWGEFVPRVRRLEIAFEKDKWPAKPSGLCAKWCAVGRQRCEFCGR